MMELSKDHIDQLESELNEARRQLKIEASLERVRAEAMAMYSSDDIGDVALKLFDEINLSRSSVGVFS